MVKTLIVAAAVLFFIQANDPTTAQAHTDIALLRDVICSFETRGEVQPDRARGQFDEFGQCQIRAGTARDMGFQGDVKYLAHPRINRHFALEYLKFCRKVLGTDDPRRLLHAYNGGPYLPWEGYGDARRYVDKVFPIFQAAQRQAVAAQVFPWSRI